MCIIFFVHYNGFYFALDGQSFITQMPSARNLETPQDISQWPDDSAAERTKLQSVLDQARAIYAREVNNPEGRFLAAQGDLYAIDVDDDAKLNHQERAYLMPTDARYNNPGAAGGYADGSNRIIAVDHFSEETSRRTFREEHFHRIDAYTREMMDVPSDRFISHEMLFDAVRNAALAQQAGHGLPHYFHTPSYANINARVADVFAQQAIADGATNDPYVTLIAQENGINLANLDHAQLAWAYEQAMFMNERLEAAVKLDHPVYGHDQGCDVGTSISGDNGAVFSQDDDENCAVNKADDDHPKKGLNAFQDTEVMVKFHVLRMELEDRFAAYDAAYEADYVNPNSRATRVLSAITPELAEVYSKQWLPLTTITTHVNDPELRQMLLRAHASLRDHQSIADGATAVISEAEYDAINAKITQAGGALHAPVRFINRAGVDDDFLAIGDKVRIPVQIASDKGQEVASPSVISEPPAPPSIPAPLVPLPPAPPAVGAPAAIAGLPAKPHMGAIADEPPVVGAPAAPPAPPKPAVPEKQTLATITMSELRDGAGAADQLRANGSLVKNAGTETARFDRNKLHVDDTSQITDITVLHQLVQAHKQYNNGAIVNPNIQSIADGLRTIEGREDQHFVTEKMSAALQSGYYKQFERFKDAAGTGGADITRAEHAQMIEDAANAAAVMSGSIVVVDRHQKADDIQSSLPNATALKQKAIANERAV